MLRRSVSILLGGLFFSSLALAQDDCTKYYQEVRENVKVGFAGLGRGPDQKSAHESAYTETARGIVTAAEQKKPAEIKIIDAKRLAQDVRDAIQIDTKIVRKCSVNKEELAVATVPRNQVVNKLSARLEAMSGQAQDYVRKKDVSETDLNTYLADYEGRYQDVLSLCRFYEGCAGSAQSALIALVPLLRGEDEHKTPEKRHKVQHSSEKSHANSEEKAEKAYRVEFKDEIAEEAKNELTALIEKDGIDINDEAPKGRVVKVNCSEHDFPKIEGTNQQIVEVTCHARGTEGAKTKFTYAYGAKGTGTSAREARAVALSQLKREK